ncbi:IPT/TIG domain-containing protein [Catenuloplanes atrovinosus]|uniref:IPT/TIG domain-containing protein n=1 Tax=Catenuloplanes atrovinosus TaxID=137266 RepID=A0AAE3YLV7_9ACTN|nr:IPT/TIG domain-containing protein [Catenuloplanes atrovinosus]MDR7274840.1 hypothetical protein [Catenuloplanes atrovinosus]
MTRVRAGRMLAAGVTGMLLAVATAAVPTAAAAAVPAASEASIGVNLTGITDWTTEWPFVDVMRTARVWISQSGTPGAPWGSGPPVAVDDKGWVTRLAPGQHVDTAIFTNAPAWPKGTYVVTWKGSGDVRIWGGGTESNRTANRFEYVPGTTNGQFLRITRTDPADHVRDIHIWMPGFEHTGAAQVFHPDYLASLRGMRTLRFMDWMRTNASDVTEYHEYPAVDQATQTTTGVAPELMIDLANRLDADPWFTMPAKASDDLVRRFAQTVKARLDPDRTVYLEYSNELWNNSPAFSQTWYAQERGLALGLSATAWQAGLRYQAYRSVRIFDIWREVLGDRVVRVLGLQAANPDIADEVLDWPVDGVPAAARADAIAIAPYFDCSDTWLPGDRRSYFPGSPAVAARVKAGGVGKLLDACQKSIDTAVRTWIGRYAAIADSYGLSLTAYEAGQHLAGIGGAENDAALTALFHKANRDPRMRDLYARYIEQWRQLGGGSLQMFTSAGAMSKYGAWGLREFQSQPLSAAPKAQAVREQLQAVGQLPLTVGTPAVTTLSARTGLVAGGAKITVAGTHLGSTSQVRFGDVNAVFSSTTSGGVTRLTVVTPAMPGGGYAPLTITNPAGTSAPAPFTFLPPPSATALSGATALTTGVTTLTLTGTGLTGARVSVGGVAARNVRVLSGTQLTFTAPARATTGATTVTVTTATGTSGGLPLTYVNPPRPEVTGLSADAGPAQAASTVVVTGSHFTGTSRVTIGSRPAAFTVLSDSQLRVTLPPQPGGTWVNLHVTTPGGTSLAGEATDFRYVALPRPTITALSAGSAAVGQAVTVTLTGTDLRWATRVTVGGAPAVLTRVGDTEITARFPVGRRAGTAQVVVTTPSGASPAIPFTYRAS